MLATFCPFTLPIILSSWRIMESSLLYSEGLDWYSPALKDEGASMAPLGRGLYLVRLRSSP